MEDLATKRKIVSEMATGIHLVTISDLFYLNGPDKKPMKLGNFFAIVVRFKNGKNESHEQTYLLDGGIRQKYLLTMLRAAKAIKAGEKPTRNDAVGKRLYIAIQECNYVNDDTVILGHDGNPLIEYYVFKVFPFMEEGRKPSMIGDPEKNGGFASDDFVTYKNVSDGISKEELPEVRPEFREKITAMPKKVLPAIKDDLPIFDEPKVVTEPMAESKELDMPDFGIDNSEDVYDESPFKDDTDEMNLIPEFEI